MLVLSELLLLAEQARIELAVSPVHHRHAVPEVSRTFITAQFLAAGMIGPSISHRSAVSATAAFAAGGMRTRNRWLSDVTRARATPQLFELDFFYTPLLFCPSTFTFRHTRNVSPR